MTITVFLVPPTPHLCNYKNSWPISTYPSLSSSSKLIVPLCSPSPPTSIIEEGPSPSPDELPVVVDSSEFTRYNHPSICYVLSLATTNFFLIQWL